MTLSPTSSRSGGSAVGDPPYLGSLAGQTSGAIGNTECYISKVWVPLDFTVVSIGFRVDVAAGNMLLGIYNDGGARLFTSGSFAVPAQGARSHILAQALALSEGWCYVAIQASDGGAKFYLSSAGIGVGFFFANTFGNGLPANLPALTNLATPIPLTLHP